MSELIRMSFSIEKELYRKVEQAMELRGYDNRSEYVRDLLREKLVDDDWQAGESVVGTIMLVYDHHVPNLTQKLTHLQHHHEGAVLATTHVHVTHELCAEMIMVRGEASELGKLVNEMRRQRGVLHGTLSTSSIDLA